MKDRILPAVFVQRVFNIKHDKQIGTTTLIEFDKENYFVTAKHMFLDAKDSQKITIELNKDDQWKKLEGVIHFHNIEEIDIVIIKPTNLAFSSSGINFKDIPLIFGDEGFFLGFPLLKKTKDNSRINEGFPFPLVKKAIFSGSSNENNVNVLFFDLHNNKGFSGGPLFFKDRFKDGDNQWHLVGVLSGYLPQNNELVTPFGNLVYSENSGILVAYGCKHIHEILSKVNK